LCCIGLCAFTLSACQTFSQERIIYERKGVRIGLQTDPSVQRSSSRALNAHPSPVTTQELLSLLGAVRVSGWSGTILGFLEAPRSIPLFDDADLRAIVTPIAEAFRQAAPTDRVLFTLPNPTSAYGDATTGALFIRGAYLHLVVTDHKNFSRADTAGGDEKDPRDTKGMKLGVVHPYRAATLPSSEEPDWAPFETVHLSLDVKELAAQDRRTPAGDVAKIRGEPIKEEVKTQPTESLHDLRLQIRELTQSNLDLRDRLNHQARELEELKEELARLRRESDGSKPKKPASRKPSSP
jgi:hypothetical protein